MPKKIILMRHGETDFNDQGVMQGSSDTFLNARGYDQAKTAGQKLKNEKIDIIFSSNLKRAYQTAYAVSEVLHIPIIQSSLLQERNFGELEGRAFTDIRTYASRFGERGNFTGWWNTAFDVETEDAMMKRLSAFRNTLEAYEDKTILIVSHGVIIRYFLKLYGISAKDIAALPFENTATATLLKQDTTYLLQPVLPS